MIDEFLLRALLAGAGTALAAGPLGCFVVWRRMAYFGDATAHSAMLGVALGLATALPIFVGVTIMAFVVAVTVATASGKGFAADTLLGVTAHAALAIGLVVLALLPGVRVDLMGYLFGDVLSVRWSDVAAIWAAGGAVLALLAWFWRALLIATLSEDMAAAQGHSALLHRLVLMLTLALLVAASLKVVGALLITALLILPAAAARMVARTPEAMAVIAVLIGMAATALGLTLSYLEDTPAGPSIVVAAVALLALAALAGRAQRI